MITEKLYKDSVTSIEKLYERADEIYSASSRSVDLLELEELTDVVTCLCNLLSYCTNDYSKDVHRENNLEYFIYEQHFGKDADEYYITDEDGTEYRNHNVDELWEYMKKFHGFKVTGEEQDNGN